jgi:niacin transporter
MINAQVLKLTQIKELIFTVTFVVLAVLTPMVFHFFSGVSAGRTFLPMHFFVLVAGLLLGWRAGLIVGAFSPSISFLISGMPAINILPFIIVELSAYGLATGLLRQKYNLWISLLGAIILGRVAVLAAIFLFSDMNAVNYIFQAISNGWQGIILQLIFAPVIVNIIDSSLFQREVRRD